MPSADALFAREQQQREWLPAEFRGALGCVEAMPGNGQEALQAARRERQPLQDHAVNSTQVSDSGAYDNPLRACEAWPPDRVSNCMGLGGRADYSHRAHRLAGRRALQRTGWRGGVDDAAHHLSASPVRLRRILVPSRIAAARQSSLAPLLAGKEKRFAHLMSFRNRHALLWVIHHRV